MNTDTHYNPGGGGAAYKVRKGDEKIQPGDRVRTTYGAERLPVYATVEKVADDGEAFLLRLDDGLIRARHKSDITFHGRPHAAFNKGARP